MSPEREHAEVLLRKAQDDQLALALLAADDRIADSVVGFHGQQAIEKALKAVLAIEGVDYPWSHDLGLLFERLGDAGVDVPASVRAASVLSPWAVEFRYGDVLDESLDREGAQKNVAAVVQWATRRLATS